MPTSDQQTVVRQPEAKANTMRRLPLPPFNRETAIGKVRLAEDCWNSRDPEKVALFISEGTVKSHAKGIFAKLNVMSRTEAVANATRRGLIQL